MSRIDVEQVLADLHEICTERPDHVGPARYRTGDGERLDECAVAVLLTRYGVSQGELRNSTRIAEAPRTVTRRFTRDALFVLAVTQGLNDAGYKWGAMPKHVRGRLDRRIWLRGH